MFKITNKFFICVHTNIEETRSHISSSRDYITSTDFHDSYQSLNKDYGPINICDIIQFAHFINNKINDIKLVNRKIIYYVYNDNDSIDLLNAILLAGAYLIIKENLNADDVIFKLCHIFNNHISYYVDCNSKYGGYYTSITDCFKTIYFIKKKNIIDFDNFDIYDYNYLTDFAFRDMNIIANKFLAMSTPTNITIPYIKEELLKRNIKTIIRLNEKDSYDKTLFNNIDNDKNINVVEFYFEDYTTPTIELIRNFMSFVNDIPHDKIIAIHCKAGLGRTGLLICIWLIIKYDFTSSNAIAFIRLMRPGSIHGYQGFFLESIDSFKNLI